MVRKEDEFLLCRTHSRPHVEKMVFCTHHINYAARPHSSLCSAGLNMQADLAGLFVTTVWAGKSSLPQVGSVNTHLTQVHPPYIPLSMGPGMLKETDQLCGVRCGV